jgi:hypothetical protein
VRTELFRVVDADEQLAAKTDAWRLTRTRLDFPKIPVVDISQ